MKLDAADTIAGFPILQVRKLLQNPLEWNQTRVVRVLKTDRLRADNLIAELSRRGLIKQVPRAHGEIYWANSTNGNALAKATAARLLKRATAQRAFDQCLDRVRQVRDERYWLWRVERVYLFGSMLTDKPLVSDVDLMVELRPKEENAEKHRNLSARRIQAARKAGRRFSNYIAELAWPQSEVWAFLKSRSRAISLMSGGLDDCTELGKHKLVYQHPE